MDVPFSEILFKRLSLFLGDKEVVEVCLDVACEIIKHLLVEVSGCEQRDDVLTENGASQAVDVLHVDVGIAMRVFAG